jgi:hypothetical protein
MLTRTPRCSCCNLLAVILWSLSTDKLGRRTIINTCQTLVCVILFVVGGLYWTGATTGNAAAGTALVSGLTDHVHTHPIPDKTQNQTETAVCGLLSPVSSVVYRLSDIVSRGVCWLARRADTPTSS